MDFNTVNRMALSQFVLSNTTTPEMVTFLAKQTEQVIVCDPGSSSSSRQLPPLPTFIASIIINSQVPVSTLTTSAVYLDRLRSRLPADAKGMCCTAHRIFLSCLILASKTLNDTHPFNRQWAKYSRAVKGYKHFSGFSVRDVNLMERQLLFLLGWDLRVHEEHLLHVLEPFLAPIRRDILTDMREWYVIPRKGFGFLTLLPCAVVGLLFLLRFYFVFPHSPPRG